MTEKTRETQSAMLLYYKFVFVDNPGIERVKQLEFCKFYKLTGRIIISKNGINGTISGTKASAEKYIEFMDKSLCFGGIKFKKSFGLGIGKDFQKLSIKVKRELVSSNSCEMLEFGPHTKNTAKYLSAENLRNWFISGKEFYIIDLRNDFEFEVGHFKNSILLPGMENFRNLPKALEDLKHLKSKTILTCCTGGIRCEIGSGFMEKMGFNDVYQLDGGIAGYIEKYPNIDFVGKLFVFDNRKITGFNLNCPTHEIIGKCRICKQKSENFIDYTRGGIRSFGIICNQCIERKLVKLDIKKKSEMRLFI